MHRSWLRMMSWAGIIEEYLRSLCEWGDVVQLWWAHRVARNISAMPKGVNYNPGKINVSSFEKTLSATLALLQVYIHAMEVQKSQIEGSVMEQMIAPIWRVSFCLIQHVEDQVQHPRVSSQCFPTMNLPDHLQKKLLSHSWFIHSC